MDRASRAIVAAFTCAGCAIPSLIWSQDFDLAARLLGVAMFAIASAIVVITFTYEQWVQDENVRTAIRIGYGTRLTLSLLFPLGMAIDLFPGMLSLSIAGLDGAGRGASFALVLRTTIVQGILLHVILWLFIAIVLPIVRAVRKRRERVIPAFPVIMPKA
jgi:predicted membrane protein